MPRRATMTGRVERRRNRANMRLRRSINASTSNDNANNIDNLEMGNTNSTSKVIEISDSENDDEIPLQSNNTTHKTTEKIVENLKEATDENKLAINEHPTEDNIIIDSDDDHDTSPNENDNLVELQETAKTYYQPEFINIELLNKIEPKASTPEPKTEVDKRDDSKFKSDKKIEQIDGIKVIELLDDNIETNEIKEDVQVDRSLDVADASVAVDKKELEPEIIDLDKNDVHELVEEPKEKDTITDLKDDIKRDLSCDVIIDKKLVEGDKYDKANEEMIDVFVFDKNDGNKQDEASPKLEADENQTSKDNTAITLVHDINSKTTMTDNVVNYGNINVVKSNVVEDVIDLDDSADSETLANEINEKSVSETLQDLVNDINMETNSTNIDCGSQTLSNNSANIMDKNAFNDDKLIEDEKNTFNPDETDAIATATNEHIGETVNTEISVNIEKIEVDNTHAEEEDVIDLDANDNEAAEISFHNESEKLIPCCENKKNDEHILEETNIVDKFYEKSPDTNQQIQDDPEIISLDGNDIDDNKKDEKQTDSKIETPQEIENQKTANEIRVNVKRLIMSHINDLSNEVEMEIDHPTDHDVIDLGLDNNEIVDEVIKIATQNHTRINANDKQDTVDIESNLENMIIDNQANNMEMEVELEEQPKINNKIDFHNNNDIQIEANNKIHTKSDEEIVVNKTDPNMDVEDHVVIPQQECVNYHCSRTTSITSPAPIFVLSFYRINKKANKRQFVCEKCYDDCTAQYEQMAGDIIAQKSILFKPKLQPDLIELSDSEDEDASASMTRRKNPGSNINRNYIENNESNRNALGNLEELIEKAFSQINIDLQLKKRTDIINRTIEKNEATSTALFNDIRELQKSADKMHFTLYQKYPNRIIKELPPIDLNKEDILNLPPIGDMSYPQIQVGKKYLAPRHAISGAWVECEALETAPNHPSDSRKHGIHWKVMFCRRATKLVLSIKHIAYSVPPDVRLNVGTRVVAIFQQVPVPKQSFFPGTVGETLKDSNKYRYLIFFDDGYCQYVKHEHVRLICEVSTNVWEDIDGNPGTSRFIQEFLTQFHNRISRPMLLAKRGQKIVTEFNGIWKLSKVVDVDCNLIKMYIEKNQTFEWIYRGSSRFAPIFKHRQIGSDLQLNAINYHLKKRNEPYIEMTLDEISDLDYQTTDNNRVAEMQTDPKGLEHPTATRAVARKSTNNQGSKNYMNSNNGAVNKAPVSLNNSVIVVDDDKMPKGKVTYYETTKRYSTTTYIAHKCTPACLVRVEDNLEPFNPIARPLLSGWERQICKYKSRKIAIYRAPCGRRLRTMLEVHRYLRLTDSPLNVECFDYDTTMHCLAEYTDLPQYIRNTDLSDGTEKMPISCCNYFDKTTPPTCTYSTNRIPTEGVNLNLDTDFLCACDCEDDCIDKLKCQCWQLTIKGSCSINSSIPVDDIGYCFKRLLNPVPTGIYECNSRCKCKQNCLNRVVQHPLSVKLQVFKTTNRGWGLRTLHDIPKGSFICIYAGDLLTEQSSNELGAKEGDEYFAELDYIEAVEGLKEGYESDIPREEGDEEPEGEKDDDFENSADSDDDEFTSKCKAIDKKITTRSSTRSAKNQDSKKSNSSNRPSSIAITVPVAVTTSADDDDCITISDDEEVRAPVNFIPNTSYDDDTEVDSKYKSVRKLFGKDELGYVMDAKRNGNIGRYFNHSCNPNLFVQNVFVDTHDLRFPWVTFFSNTSIQAGTELTWNYNYDVGCVPGKVLYCQCDSSNCRGRLL